MPCCREDAWWSRETSSSALRGRGIFLSGRCTRRLARGLFLSGDAEGTLPEPARVPSEKGSFDSVFPSASPKRRLRSG